MRSFLLIALCVYLSYPAIAQTVLFEKEIQLKRGLTEKREAYPITNSDGSLALFLLDKNSIKAHLFSKDLDLIDTLDGLRPSNHEELLGGNIAGGYYNLFFSSKPYRSFGISRCHFADRTVSQHAIELPAKKEKYVGSASYGDKFFIFTVVRATSILNLYVFNDHAKYDTYTFDFKDQQFAPLPYSKLFDVLHNNQFAFIDNMVPNAIELVAKKNKLYGYDNKLVLTLDNEVNKTTFITIDLTTFKSDIASYDQAKPSCVNLYPTSNSYIYKDHLYQFSACPNEMVLSVGSLKQGEIVQEFRVNKEDEIYFRNSAIIQEGPSLGGESERELSKTKQFLRKVSRSEIGISVYETSAGIEVMLGGYKEIQTGAGGGGMMMGGGTISTPMGPVAMAPTYNPTFYGYSAYKFTKSVYFKSLLNSQTFDHEEGVVPNNIFDKIQAFTKGMDDSMTAETLFKKDGACVLGYYLKTNRHYVMRAFMD